jgi:2-oxoglutarate dehydrogenase E1 component
MLYPFPDGATRDLIRRYPNLQEIVWVQEEPSNFGARKWMVPQIGSLVEIPVRYVSRPERSSPAEGYPAAHRQEQDRIIAEALA